ncbi:hypothetical protein ACH5RR_013371 [Cinchona calisaya]|uniref:Uncharacterized protein n=1 Tax=Cinchona calisaya TaxID=153742 RepID=A0ABD2ZZU1_9GENT
MRISVMLQAFTLIAKKILSYGVLTMNISSINNMNNGRRQALKDEESSTEVVYHIQEEKLMMEYEVTKFIQIGIVQGEANSSITSFTKVLIKNRELDFVWILA